LIIVNLSGIHNTKIIKIQLTLLRSISQFLAVRDLSWTFNFRLPPFSKRLMFLNLSCLTYHMTVLKVIILYKLVIGYKY